VTDAEKARAFKAERRRQAKRAAAIQAETFAAIQAHLAEAERRIAARLAATPSDFDAWRLRNLQDEVRAAMDVWSTRTSAVLDAGFDRSWAAGSDLVVEPLRAAGVDLRAVLPKLDPRLLGALKSFQTDKIRDISTTAVARINTEIAQAAIGTQTPFEAARKTAEHLKAPADRARSIVRTELGTAYSEAGQQRMSQAVKAGVTGLQKQWRRSGKLHPRVTHELADGQIVDVDQPFIVGGIAIPKPRDPTIPAGERINCGCASLPFMKHWAVKSPGARPYAAEELARSPAVRQAADARGEVATDPVPPIVGTRARQRAAIERSISPDRLATLERSLAETAWAGDHGSAPAGLTAEEALAIHAYTYGPGEAGSGQINRALRGLSKVDRGEQPGRLVPLIEVMSEGLSKLPPVRATTERYVTLPAQVLDRMTVGGTWWDAGFLSSTLDAAGMEDYFTGKPHRLIINGVSGRAIRALSAYPGQDEVLHRPGTRFIVTARIDLPGGIVIELDEEAS